MILNERILGLIVTLAEELHFGRAAARLYVSQPALSGTLKSLERDLGVRLFRRTSRHVELTDAGHVFVAEARRLLAETERAVALVRGTSSDILGPLRIGYPASVDLRWLASLVARARGDALLAADVRFVSAEAVELDDQLIKGTLHAAFVSGRLSHPDLVCVPLFRDPLRVALGAEHPLARCRSLRFEQLEGEPVVWLRGDLNPLLYGSFLDLCSTQHYRPNLVQEVRTFLEGFEFARQGLGITFLPSSFQSPNGHDSVMFADLPPETLYIEAGLAFRRDRGLQGLERFARFVKDHLPE